MLSSSSITLKFHTFCGFSLISTVILWSIPAETRDAKCSNGNLPLLDEQNQTFPCHRQCPDTFYCENQRCCPNITDIDRSTAFPSPSSTDKKRVEFQIESSIELDRILSCERIPYKISCQNRSSSQPLAKWYFDIQTLSCEVYPYGMCENDPTDKFALRSKEECEERCDVAKVNAAIGDISGLLNGNGLSTEDIEREPPRLPTTPEAQIAIHDVVQESKHLRVRPYVIEPPTDLIHIIYAKKDGSPDLTTSRQTLEKSQKFSKTSELSAEIDENQLLTGTVHESTVPTVTSNTLEVFESTSDGLEGSGITGSAETSDEKVVENQTNPLKITKESWEQLHRKNQSDSLKTRQFSIKYSVSCTSSSYRLFCNSGEPSQFVYRWEKVGGVCQSFPYGYCLNGSNIAHPRTKAECEQFCK